MARSYAPLAIVPAVPITPIVPVLVAATAARAPGSITPTTGTEERSFKYVSACAVLVLHATTTVFTPRCSRYARISPLYRRTVSGGFGPDGRPAVAPN